MAQSTGIKPLTFEEDDAGTENGYTGGRRSSTSHNLGVMWSYQKPPQKATTISIKVNSGRK